MKWITRERAKVDRIACPWLITRFVDPTPEFVYVPADRVVSEAARLGAIPYDIPDVELGHRGPLCSFDSTSGKLPYRMLTLARAGGTPATVPALTWCSSATTASLVVAASATPAAGLATMPIGLVDFEAIEHEM